MEFYTPEVLWNILLRSDYDTILDYCRTSLHSNICSSNAFWLQKAQRDFNIPSNIFNQTTLSPSQRYLQILTQNGKVAIGSEKYIPWQEFALRASRQRSENLFIYATENGKLDMESRLWAAAAGGWKNLVNVFLKVNHNYLDALGGAAYGGNRELFDYIMSLPTIFYEWRWNLIAENALRGGNKDIFDYVYTLAGKDSYDWNWNGLAVSAALSGDKDLFDHIFLLFPDYEFDWNIIAEYAASSGNRQLFDHVLFLGTQEEPDIEWDWFHILSASISRGHEELSIYIISKIPKDELDWDYLNMIADRHNKKDLLDRLQLLFKQAEISDLSLDHI
jgi:hypothetical protein